MVINSDFSSLYPSTIVILLGKKNVIRKCKIKKIVKMVVKKTYSWEAKVVNCPYCRSHKEIKFISYNNENEAIRKVFADINRHAKNCNFNNGEKKSIDCSIKITETGLRSTSMEWRTHKFILKNQTTTPQVDSKVSVYEKPIKRYIVDGKTIESI